MGKGKHHQSDKRKGKAKNANSEVKKDEVKETKDAKQEQEVYKIKKTKPQNLEAKIKNEEKRQRIKIISVISIIILVILAVYFFSYYWSIFGDQIEVSQLLSKIEIGEKEVKRTGKTERMLQLKELQRENSDIVGWLEIGDTKISYPVMQSKDNEFYMNRNYKKQSNQQGSIFLDKAYDWDIPSMNLLIYGKDNTVDSSMFEDLKKYSDESFYQTHSTIRFTTEKEDSYYDVIAAFWIENNEDEENAFYYDKYVNFNNEKEYNKYIENVNKRALYDTGKTAKYKDQLMTLSTCSEEGTNFVVVAKKGEKIEP